MDEVFSITSRTAQHIRMYREDDFACVFWGRVPLSFQNRCSGKYFKHVLSQQQDRLEAYIDQSL